MTRRQILAAVLLAMPLIAVLCAGCEDQSNAQLSADFAPGAFPPTLSDMDYHRQSWTRRDCLTCHEQGKQESPIMKHTSVPPLAKDAKCRTCHVFIVGSQPIGR